MNALFNVILLIGGGLILKKMLEKQNKIIKGSYIVPENLPNRLDALHSFEKRQSDNFGGFMSTKINKALRDMYAKGINPDIKNLSITIDPVKYSVTWAATIGPSTDGRAFVGMYTRGSAGAGADNRAKDQVKNIESNLKNSKHIELIKDLNFNNKVKIRQFFYKYSLNSYPDL